jgi:hypothetical protein
MSSLHTSWIGNVLSRWRQGSGDPHRSVVPEPETHGHHWFHVNAYEPEDEIEPQWGRKRVECEGCGEQRLVHRFLALDAIW